MKDKALSVRTGFLFTNMFKYDAHKTGAVNELKAQIYYTNIGYDVFTPIHNKTRADFVAVKDKEVLRVQVKTAQYNGPYIQSRLDVHNVRYSSEDCDVIFFILEDRMWIAPIEEVAGMSSICLGKVDDPNYKPRKEYNPNNWEIN